MTKKCLAFLVFSLFYQTVACADLKILATGDVMLGRFVEERYGDRIESPRIKEIFDSAGVAFGNLEACFGDGTRAPAKEGKIVLKAPNESVSVLKNLGFTIVSLANNHCEDFGSGNIVHTQSLLESKNIKSFGGSSNFGRAHPLILKVKGKNLGFVGYSAHVTRP